MAKAKGIIKIFLEDHVVLRQLGLNNTFKTLPVDNEATSEVVQQKMIKALSRFERETKKGKKKRKEKKKEKKKEKRTKKNLLNLLPLSLPPLSPPPPSPPPLPSYY